MLKTIETFFVTKSVTNSWTVQQHIQNAVAFCKDGIMERGITWLVLKWSSEILKVTWCLSTLFCRLAAWVAVYLSTKMVGWKHQEWAQTSKSPVQQPKQLSPRTFRRPVIDFSFTFQINKRQCSFKFYEMRLNNMYYVCWVSRTVEKASGICILRRTDIFRVPNKPVDWRHTQGTVSGSVLPFCFSFAQPNVMVCSYHFCFEYLGQSLSPVTISMLHRFLL